MDNKIITATCDACGKEMNINTSFKPPASEPEGTCFPGSSAMSSITIPCPPTNTEAAPSKPAAPVQPSEMCFTDRHPVLVKTLYGIAIFIAGAFVGYLTWAMLNDENGGKAPAATDQF